MGQALYRKYRSKSLSEIVGQEHIITTLQNALKKGHLSHAYLFTGPRGVGKTSIARILAHEINQLPYDDESVHIDIIEIDAASNRRIDEIRDLRDKVHLAPSSAKYKVYIIDEVHMLTREAFNALLKTLEEPPEHVVFILATTEVHKLPETIVSRTQRFTFRPIETELAVKHLRQIANKEKIKISDEALELIAQFGDGSFRDSISLLDQASSYGGQVEADDIRSNLGIAPHAVVSQLLETTFSGSTKQLVESFQAIREQGYEAGQLAKQLAAQLRQELVKDRTRGAQLASLLHQLIEVPASHDPTASLEVILLESNLSKPANSSDFKVADKPAKQQPKTAPARVEPSQVTVEEPIKIPTKKPPVKAKQSNDFAEAWQKTLDTIRQHHNTLYGVLRMAEAEQAGGTVKLTFKFPFHQKRLYEPKNKKLVSDLLAEQLGSNFKLECLVKTSPEPLAAAEELTKPAPALDTISNIFGAAEVLES